MNTVHPHFARLSELVVDHVLGELTPEDAGEFEQLRRAHPEFDALATEQAAAALQLASETEFETLPERLRIRIATAATEHFAPQWRAAEANIGVGVTTLEIEPRRALNSMAGWWVAAAGFALAFGLWITRPQPGATPVLATSNQPTAVPTLAPIAAPVVGPAAAPPVSAPSIPRPTDAAGAAAEREQLLAANRAVLVRPWRAGKDPTGNRVTGDVVWDAGSQRGFMRFAGLRRNNPNVEQYQLWIFDARRDERYPIDGGVFNISGDGGEEVIAIKAALRVGVPLTFAVTVERPGGVVVSDRARIAALANSG